MLNAKMRELTEPNYGHAQLDPFSGDPVVY